MAEYTFQIVSIEASLKGQTVSVNFNLDVDEDSVTVDNIYLMDREKKNIVPADYEVDGRTIVLHLKGWARPNHEYSLSVGGGIQSIVGDNIEHVMPFVFRFKSAVTSTVEILSPAAFAEVNGALEIKWEEKGDTPVHQYLVQVAKENSFFNVIYSSKVDKTDSEEKIHSVTFGELKESGQYYIRIRAEKDSEYGDWSDVISFVTKVEEETIVIEEPEEEKPRPELPEIIDYVNQESSSDSTARIQITDIVPETELYEDTPEEFVFICPPGIDIANATVKVERRSI